MFADTRQSRWYMYDDSSLSYPVDTSYQSYDDRCRESSSCNIDRIITMFRKSCVLVESSSKQSCPEDMLLIVDKVLPLVFVLGTLRLVVRTLFKLLLSRWRMAARSSDESNEHVCSDRMDAVSILAVLLVLFVLAVLFLSSPKLMFETYV